MGKQQSLELKKKLDILKEFYPDFGAEYCAEKLNIKKKAILDLAYTHKIKRNSISSFDLAPFENIVTPEAAYVLGFIWADGTVTSSSRCNRINVYCLKKDFETIEEVFYKTGKWKTSTRTPENRQEIQNLRVDNKNFADFLVKYFYHAKSEYSACKILSKIPDHLKHYWFRGLVDGDGCFYTNVKNKCYQFCCASSYNQDWTYFCNLCDKLKIKYTINKTSKLNKTSNKINSSSTIRFCGTKKIKIFFDYIYNNYQNDKIGFPRKYEKAKFVADLLS